MRKILRSALRLMGLIGILAAPALATITVSPAQPSVERSATVSVSAGPGVFINPQTVTWNFGDGTATAGLTVVSKTYLSAGTFTIAVRYQVGAAAAFWVNESLTITVVEPRRITFTPSIPVVGQPVSFTAQGFYSPSIQWDFGDESNPILGSSAIAHPFTSPGVYAVQARDFGGQGAAVITTSLTVGASTGVITVVPSSPNVDEKATFTISREYFQITPSSVRWTFGDGSTVSGSTTASKAYARTGTFVISVRYFAVPAGASGTWFTDSKAITVLERRKITVAPAAPFVQQSASFTAVNFFSGSVRWDFGDNTPAVVGGTLIEHVYAEPGNYTVRAKDFGGTGAGTITALVTVGIDVSRRRIFFAPRNAVPRQPLTFSARNFYTAAILWDFGDGTPPVSGSISAVHSYARKGTYLVAAWDWNGKGDPTVQAVTVGEETGPSAPFRIFVLQLRFADGLAYKVVPQGETGLRAFFDVKYEGTGLFEAQWLVDGMPFRPVTRIMPFAASTTIDSGPLPGLPTTAPGIHEVGLRIVRPDIDFTVPVIRYYVVAGGRGTGNLRSARIEVKEAEGLKGVSCSLTLDTLKAPTGSYFILSGSVRHSLPEAVKFGLLRIHLGDALVDQQLLRSIEPGADRAFKTSIKLPPDAPNALYIALYDISDSPRPRLLHIKKIAVAPQPSP